MLGVRNANAAFAPVDENDVPSAKKQKATDSRRRRRSSIMKRRTSFGGAGLEDVTNTPGRRKKKSGKKQKTKHRLNRKRVSFGIVDVRVFNKEKGTTHATDMGSIKINELNTSISSEEEPPAAFHAAAKTMPVLSLSSKSTGPTLASVLANYKAPAAAAVPSAAAVITTNAAILEEEEAPFTHRVTHQLNFDDTAELKDTPAAERKLGKARQSTDESSAPSRESLSERRASSGVNFSDLDQFLGAPRDGDARQSIGLEDAGSPDKSSRRSSIPGMNFDTDFADPEPAPAAGASKRKSSLQANRLSLQTATLAANLTSLFEQNEEAERMDPIQELNESVASVVSPATARSANLETEDMQSTGVVQLPVVDEVDLDFTAKVSAPPSSAPPAATPACEDMELTKSLAAQPTEEKATANGQPTPAQEDADDMEFTRAVSVQPIQAPAEDNDTDFTAKVPLAQRTSTNQQAPEDDMEFTQAIQVKAPAASSESAQKDDDINFTSKITFASTKEETDDVADDMEFTQAIQVKAPAVSSQSAQKDDDINFTSKITFAADQKHTDEKEADDTADMDLTRRVVAPSTSSSSSSAQPQQDDQDLQFTAAVSFEPQDDDDLQFTRPLAQANPAPVTHTAENADDEDEMEFTKAVDVASAGPAPAPAAQDDEMEFTKAVNLQSAQQSTQEQPTQEDDMEFTRAVSFAPDTKPASSTKKATKPAASSSSDDDLAFTGPVFRKEEEQEEDDMAFTGPVQVNARDSQDEDDMQLTGAVNLNAKQTHDDSMEFTATHSALQSNNNTANNNDDDDMQFTQAVSLAAQQPSAEDEDTTGLLPDLQKVVGRPSVSEVTARLAMESAGILQGNIEEKTSTLFNMSMSDRTRRMVDDLRKGLAKDCDVDVPSEDADDEEDPVPMARIASRQSMAYMDELVQFMEEQRQEDRKEEAPTPAAATAAAPTPAKPAAVAETQPSKTTPSASSASNRTSTSSLGSPGFPSEMPGNTGLFSLSTTAPTQHSLLSPGTGKLSMVDPSNVDMTAPMSSAVSPAAAVAPQPQVVELSVSDFLGAANVNLTEQPTPGCTTQAIPNSATAPGVAAQVVNSLHGDVDEQAAQLRDTTSSIEHQVAQLMAQATNEQPELFKAIQRVDTCNDSIELVQRLFRFTRAQATVSLNEWLVQCSTCSLQNLRHHQDDLSHVHTGMLEAIVACERKEADMQAQEEAAPEMEQLKKGVEEQGEAIRDLAGQLANSAQQFNALQAEKSDILDQMTHAEEELAQVTEEHETAAQYASMLADAKDSVNVISKVQEWTPVDAPQGSSANMCLEFRKTFRVQLCWNSASLTTGLDVSLELTSNIGKDTAVFALFHSPSTQGDLRRAAQMLRENYSPKTRVQTVQQYLVSVGLLCGRMLDLHYEIEELTTTHHFNTQVVSSANHSEAPHLKVWITSMAKRAQVVVGIPLSTSYPCYQLRNRKFTEFDCSDGSMDVSVRVVAGKIGVGDVAMVVNGITSGYDRLTTICKELRQQIY